MFLYQANSGLYSRDSYFVPAIPEFRVAVRQLEVVDVLEVFGEVVASLELPVAEVAQIDGPLLQVLLLHVHGHRAPVSRGEVAALVLAVLLVGWAVDEQVVGQVGRHLGAVVAELAGVEFDVRVLGRRKKYVF